MRTSAIRMLTRECYARSTGSISHSAVLKLSPCSFSLFRSTGATAWSLSSNAQVRRLFSSMHCAARSSKGVTLASATARSVTGLPSKHRKTHFSLLESPCPSGLVAVFEPCRQSRGYATYTTTSNESSSSGKPSGPPKSSFVQTFARFIARSTSFLFYCAVVGVGLGFTGLAGYYFVTTLLLPSSDIQLQNKAESLISAHPECQAALGSKLSFYGESSSNRWSRNRPVATSRGIDQYGVEHLWMRFYTMGDQKVEGTVQAELLRPKDGYSFDFKYLTVQVGDKRIAVIEDPALVKKQRKASGNGHGIEFMGVRIWPLK
ncbi:TIM21-domain-containing protein [Myxozyma melibiosi]|uniref:Mitochondrial import inner membrane translocase subunit Tim21 n=1 Tax=Myxozyma melibiosi TaxID=54550 RepID=A0ABR1FF30_9ASCO